jgi:hypothetical protein
MGDFTFLYRGGMASASPEERQKHMEKWMTWFKDMGAKGLIKDPGHPLESGGKVVRGKPMTVNDGPFAEAKDIVGGYTLISASDLAQAAEVAKGCPILEMGGSVEVRPVMQMNM